MSFDISFAFPFIKLMAVTKRKPRVYIYAENVLESFVGDLSNSTKKKTEMNHVCACFIQVTSRKTNEIVTYADEKRNKRNSFLAGERVFSKDKQLK